MATQVDLAKHLDLSTTKVGELVQGGVITPGASLDEARVAYIRHLRKRAAGHVAASTDGEVLDLTLERARLAKAQSETAELKNAELRRELVRVDEIKSEWSRRTLSWKERIRAVPASATVHVPGFTKSMARSLLSLIDETLTELADGRGDAPRKGRSRRGRKASKTAA